MAAQGQQKPATPEEIWRILREVSENQKETDRRMKETDRRMKETDRQIKETDRILKEAGREAALERKKTERNIKRLENLFHGKWGALVESLVKGDLIKLLNERGVPAGHTLTNLEKEHGEQHFEFDILAVNGEEVVVVEVKTNLQVQDVDYFLEKLHRFKDFAPEYKGKKVYGSVAYIKSEQSAHVYSERRGLFVIRATGSSSSITNRKDFQPKVF